MNLSKETQIDTLKENRVLRTAERERERERELEREGARERDYRWRHYSRHL